MLSLLFGMSFISLVLLWVKRVQASRLWPVLMGVFVLSLASFVILFASTWATTSQVDPKNGCYGDCVSN